MKTWCRTSEFGVLIFVNRQHLGAVLAQAEVLLLRGLSFVVEFRD